MKAANQITNGSPGALFALFIRSTIAVLATALAAVATSGQSTWMARAPIPTARNGAGFCTYHNKLYVFGGEYQMYGFITDRNEAYDPVSNTWSVGAPLPQPTYGCGAVPLSGQILVLGGRLSGSPGTIAPTLAAVYSYDPLAETWTGRASMPIANDSFVSAVVNGLVYIIGGYDAATDQRRNVVEIYDPTLDRWTLGPTMPAACSNAAGAVIGTRIYVFGGFGNAVGFISLVQVFETTTQTWTTKTPLPTPRDADGAAVLNGLIYVTGGGCSTAIDVYDPAADAWSAGPAMPTAGATASPAIGTLSSTGGALDSIVVAGGEHVYCSGGGYIVSDTIALRNTTPPADTTPPSTVASATPGPNGNGWNNTDVTITLNATDNTGGSGVNYIAYTLGGAQPGGGTANGGTATFTISVEGTTTVTYYAVDNAGNQEPPHSLTVRIDKTPPTVNASVTPNLLWPSNHKLVPVAAKVTVTDSLSGPAGFTLLSVASSEPDNGLGDGDQPNDIQGFLLGTACLTGQLRAERSGTGSGRIYTLTYRATDMAGNSAVATTTVTVPHDLGH